MNLSTRLCHDRAQKAGGCFQQSLPESDSGWRPPFHLVTLMVLRIRKLGLTVLATATLCSTIGRLVAADPSVEVFTQNTARTGALEGDSSLLPQLPFRWSVTTSGGYDDNVNTTPDGAGSAFTQANLTVSKDLRTARTQLSIVGGGGVVHYFDRIGGPPMSTQAVLTSLSNTMSPNVLRWLPPSTLPTRRSRSLERILDRRAAAGITSAQLIL